MVSAQSSSSGSGARRSKLGDALIRSGQLTEAQLQYALDDQKRSGRSLGHLLVEMGFITEGQRLDLMRKTLGYEQFDFKKGGLDPVVAELIPRDLAEKFRVFPLRREGKHLVVAMEDPSDEVLIAAIETQVATPLKTLVITSTELTQLMKIDPKTIREVVKGPKRRLPLSERGFLYRLAYRLSLPIVGLAPLVAFFVLIYTNEDVQRTLLDGTNTLWDIGIYTGLLWGLWAIICYEINGLIFKPDGDEDE